MMSLDKCPSLPYLYKPINPSQPRLKIVFQYKIFAKSLFLLKNICSQYLNFKISGKFKGIQACITEKHPTAHVHCVSHNLNLALSNAVNVVPIRNKFGVIEKVYTFFNTRKRRIIKSNSTFSS
jgi:hypothetical protein